MLWDAIRSYVQLATGVTEATADKAKEVAQDLLSAVGIGNSNEVAAQVSGMADEVLNAARYQRDSFIALVRAEVTTVLDSSGVAKAADVDALTARLTELASDVEALVRQLPGAAAAAEAARFVEDHTPAVLTPPALRGRRQAQGSDGSSAASAEEAERPTRKRAAAPARTSTTAKQTAAKKTAAKKTAAKKTAAKKTAVKKTSAEKTTDRAAAGKQAASAKQTSRAAAPARRATTTRKSAAAATRTDDASAEASTGGSDNG